MGGDVHLATAESIISEYLKDDLLGFNGVLRSKLVDEAADILRGNPWFGQSDIRRYLDIYCRGYRDGFSHELDANQQHVPRP